MRAAGKKLIGAQASAAIWEGVDEWLRRNPLKSVSDFLLEACMDKLEDEKIPFDRAAALIDGRRRRPASVKFNTRPYVVNEEASSTKSVESGLTSLVERAAAAVASGVPASGAGSPKRSAKVPPKAKAVPPPAAPES